MKKSYWLVLGIVLMMTVGCSKVKTPEAVAERENWYASFNDSIKFYQQKSSELESKLEELNSKISDQLQNFEKVKNPREVSGYYILKGWSSKVPLKSTGIYARLDENEKFEIIATLSGATFNQIAVGSFDSEVVKHDQALNYRHPGYNTVYFASGKADTIANYISDHRGETVYLDYIENGKSRLRFAIPENEKEMISKTWILYSGRIETIKLQKELMICSRKIDTFRRLKDDHAANSIPPSSAD